MPARTMNTRLLTSAVVALLFGAQAGASPPAAEDTLPPSSEAAAVEAYEPGVAGGMVASTVQVSATVKAIDRPNRLVTLLREDGSTVDVTVGPDAVNFDQVSVGDLVTVTMTSELIAFVAEAGDSPSDEQVAAVVRAQEGEQPGGAAVVETQVVGTIVAMDPFERLATLMFEDGSQETFPVRPDVDMTAYELGQKVVIVSRESIAIDVTKR